jgi:hypothetical protein
VRHTTESPDIPGRLNQTLYAALAHHPEHQRPPTTSDTWLTLDHTDPTTGQRHPGPPENHPHPHTLLGIPHPTYATDENDGTRLGEGTQDETAHDGDATPGTDASRPDAVD